MTLTNVQSYLVRQSLKEIYIKILKTAGMNFSEIGSIRAPRNTAAITCRHPECSEDAEHREFFIGPMTLYKPVLPPRPDPQTLVHSRQESNGYWR